MTRVFDHRIKRIIDHCTYNTETATEIAGFADKALFKTRERGDYFIAAHWKEWELVGRDPDVRGRIADLMGCGETEWDDCKKNLTERDLKRAASLSTLVMHTQGASPRLLFIRPVTPEQAKSWLEEYFPGRTLREVPDPESRSTLRMPSDLKIQIDALAKHRGQSVNAWIVRWLETGVSAEEEVTQ
jgi:hypothetical protein